MYAVIKTGGKQYKVAEGDVIKVEKLAGNAGEAVVLDQVLAVNDGKALKVGTPFVDGATVAAEVLEQARGPKIVIFKKKRRHGYRRKNGHRQELTVLRITSIGGKAKKAAAKKAAPKKAAAKKDDDAAKAAAEKE